MKLTVLSIFILLLVAGLAMIQMDADTENQSQVTENQIQVLRETEMLTTQGLGVCEQVIKDTADPGEDCGDKDCHYIGEVEVEEESQTRTVHLYGIQYAIPYNQCGGFHPHLDCVHMIRNNQLEWQYCAIIVLYTDQFCKGNVWDYDGKETPDFENVFGCPNGGGGGGGNPVVGGTSS